MPSLRSEMLDHLLEKFEEKDKTILHKMIKDSLENDDEADLAHRVFKSVVAYVEAHSTLSCLELTALEGIRETLVTLAETTTTASTANALKASDPALAETQGPQIANEVPQEVAYTHVGGEKRPPCSVEAPRYTVKDLPAELTTTQLDSQPGYVDSEMPKSSPANYGMKMMIKNGWKPGQGLGARGDGITEPVLSSEQLVPDRKDYNPGVGSRKRITSNAASQVSNAQKLHPGSTLHATGGQFTDENKKSTTSSAKGDGETWECPFDQDPLLFQSKPRHPNSYCNGW